MLQVSTIPRMIYYDIVEDDSVENLTNAMELIETNVNIYDYNRRPGCVYGGEKLKFFQNGCKLSAACGTPIVQEITETMFKMIVVCYGTGACDDTQSVACNHPMRTFRIDFNESILYFRTKFNYESWVTSDSFKSLVILKSKADQYYYTSEYCSNRSVWSYSHDGTLRMPMINERPTIDSHKICYENPSDYCSIEGPYKTKRELISNLPILVTTFYPLKSISDSLVTRSIRLNDDSSILFYENVAVDVVETKNERVVKCVTLHELSIGVSSIAEAVIDSVEWRVRAMADDVVAWFVDKIRSCCKRITVWFEVSVKEVKQDMHVMVKHLVEAVKWLGINFIIPLAKALWAEIIYPVFQVLLETVIGPVELNLIDWILLYQVEKFIIMVAIMIICKVEIIRSVIISLLLWGILRLF